MHDLHAGHRRERKLHHGTVGQGRKQAEARCVAEESAGKYADRLTVQRLQIGAEGGYDLIHTGGFDVKVIAVECRQIQVGREHTVLQVRHQGAVEALHYIHCRRIGRAVQHAHADLSGRGRFAGIVIHHEGERTGRVADHTNSHYAVGAAFSEVHVERSEHIRRGRAVCQCNAESDIAVGRYVNVRRGRAEGEIVNQ